MTFGERVRTAMAARGWTPRDLNERLGRNRTSPVIYGVLANKHSPQAKTRAALAKALRAPQLMETATNGTRQAPTKPATRRLRVKSAPGGAVRIRLDVTLPLADAAPLLRLLMGDKRERMPE